MLDMMPEQATSWAAQVDWINNFITYVSAFCTLAITGVMIVFAVRYRQKGGKDHETPYVTHNAMLESIWTVIPTLVCIFVFYYGLVVYQDMRNVPANALEIQVKGFQWRWEFLYPNGTKSTNELVVPVDTPIRLVMTSDDVLHSFFIPAMRTKEDAVPGKYSYLWFQPEKLGEYPIFCTEYCGLQHAKMLAQLRVVSNEQYQDYILERAALSENVLPEELGAKLFTVKGCNACHSLDGSRIIGPTLKGSWGTERQLESGETVVMDENYVKESVLTPAVKIVKGYPNAMTPYEGQLSDKEIDGIIAYLKTLK